MLLMVHGMKLNNFQLYENVHTAKFQSMIFPSQKEFNNVPIWCDDIKENYMQLSNTYRYIWFLRTRYRILILFLENGMLFEATNIRNRVSQQLLTTMGRRKKY